MKFSAIFVSLALLAGSVSAGSHMKRHYRRGPSATFGGSSPTPTSDAPSSTPTPPTNTPSGAGKRGLAYNDASLTKNFNSPKVSWAYNWDSSPGGDLPGGVTYFPMLWGSGGDHTANWVNNANAAIAAGSTHLLAFNEPDLSSQANLSPGDAAALWKQYMEPFHGKATLVAPAITNGGSPMGFAWLDSFFAACNDCHIDAIACHIYDSATNIAYFESYISSAGSRYGKPVLVTEFGASGSASQQQQFLQQFLPWLDLQNFVTHYAYFADVSPILANSDGSLTPLGSTYANA